MSLRLKLTLAILSVVTLTGVASLTALLINHRLQSRLAQFTRMSMVGLDEESVVGQTLEIKGHWDREGFFTATDIEKLTLSRRPKLRGAIEEIDREMKYLTLYGKRIRVDDETEYLHSSDGVGVFETLEPGRRVEVSCRVDEDGHWFARKIRTRAVKPSNKIKGIITRAEMDRGPQHVLEINGLRIHVDRGIEMSDPRSPLYLMENATQMTVSVRECLAAASRLMKEIRRERELLGRDETRQAAEVIALVDEAKGGLIDAYEDFVKYLSESRSAMEETILSASADGLDELSAVCSEKRSMWLDPLEDGRAALEDNVSRFLELTEKNPEAAGEFLSSVLQPHLEEEILPRSQAYHLETVEDLSDEFDAISSRADTAARLGIAVAVLGMLAALVLGLFVSRRISRPILALKNAARRIGQGDLEMRVAVHSGDEIGVLASTFNRMAEELAATTVSVASLNNVIDSMAGALFILTPEGRIRSVNPAAMELLGYEERELAGKHFETICPPNEDAALRPTEKGIVAVVEKVFRKKDGSDLPVSFSGAALRDDKGAVRGFVCVAQDLSGHKQMEERLRRSLSEKELLLREVHHRVKNNLQVISSLLDLQSRTISDPEAVEKFQENQYRIRSMVFLHEQLYRSGSLDHIDFRSYLESITSHLVQVYGTLSERIRLEVRAEDMALDIDRALACGLIINELVTNAFKHAFPDGRSGGIMVASSAAEDGDCVLEVSDDGLGFGNGEARLDSGSLGMSLVKTLVKQLRGSLDFNGRADGTTFRIEFPLEKGEEAP